MLEQVVHHQPVPNGDPKIRWIPIKGIPRLGGPEGFTMGDGSVRRPVASHFDKGVDFGLIIHKSPFMIRLRPTTPS